MSIKGSLLVNQPGGQKPSCSLPRRGETQNVLFGFSAVVVLRGGQTASVSCGGMFHEGMDLSVFGEVLSNRGRKKELSKEVNNRFL